MEAAPHTANALSPAMVVIADKPRLAQARALMAACATHHPCSPRYLFLVDEPNGLFDPAGEAFHVVPYTDLELPEGPKFTFRFPIAELGTALAPFVLKHVLTELGEPAAVLLSPELMLFAPLAEVEQRLDSSSVVLLSQYATGRALLGDVRRGAFRDNALFTGCLAARATPPALHLLRWWGEGVQQESDNPRQSSLFATGRALNFAPALFADVTILQELAYRHAAAEAQAGPADRRQRAAEAGKPVFCQFGDARQPPPEFTSGEDAVAHGGMADASALAREYQQMLKRHGYDECRKWKSRLETFSDGTPIPDVARRIYCQLRSEGQEFADPYDGDSPGSLLAWLNETVSEAAADRRLTRLGAAIYRQRSDLRAAFPRVLSSDHAAFCHWMETGGQQEYQLDRIFVEPYRSLRLDDGQPKLSLKQRIKQSMTRVRGRAMCKLRSSWPARALRSSLGETRWQKLKDVVLGNRRRAARQTKRVRLGRALEALPLKGVFGVNVVGFVHAESGMGEAARSSIRALSTAAVPVATLDIETNHFTRRNDHSCADFPAGHPYGFNLLHVNADLAPVVFHDLGDKFAAGKHNIGFWYWELAKFPDRWRDSFGLFDELWVASSFVLDSIAPLSPVPVIKLPPCVAPPTPPGDPAEVARRLGVPDDVFAFLFIYDLASVAARKNPFGLIEAFRQAFRPDDKAELLLKVNNGNLFPDKLAEVRRAARDLPIRVIDGTLERDELTQLQRRADAYVSLHRSEGFGLTLAESMYFGKPVVTTAYSGNMDFTTKFNSYLVDYSLVPVGEGCVPYPPDAEWAEPDAAHAAQVLRRVYLHQDEARDKGRRAAAEIRQWFSREAVGRMMLARLNAIHGPRSQSTATTTRVAMDKAA